MILSASACHLWREFDRLKEGAIRAGGEYDAIRPLANKLPEHAARLAAKLTLVRDLDAGEVTAAEMAAGIILAQHYAAEALRLHSGSRIASICGSRNRRSTGYWCTGRKWRYRCRICINTARMLSGTRRLRGRLSPSSNSMVGSPGYRKVPRLSVSDAAMPGALCEADAMAAFRIFDPYAFLSDEDEQSRPGKVPNPLAPRPDPLGP